MTVLGGSGVEVIGGSESIHGNIRDYPKHLYQLNPSQIIRNSQNHSKYA